MKNDKWISKRFNDAGRELTSGGRVTFLLFVFTGCFIFVLLFSTVHSRDGSEIINKVNSRYSQLIMFWIKRGYFQHGGLWVRRSGNMYNFLPPKDNDPVEWIYRSSPMGYLQLAHIAERIHYLFTGTYSLFLMRVHNQLLVWLSAALLGLLAMHLALHQGIRPFHALLCGFSVQAVYQTFPVNIRYYWEVYPTTIMPIFITIFLIYSRKLLLGEKLNGKHRILRALCVFGMFYIDFSTAFFFLCTYILCRAILGFPVIKNQYTFSTLVLPAATALFLFYIQILWVQWALPDVQFLGSSTLFRTGFDGSIQYYKNHFDLFGGCRVFKWTYLFWAGSGSIFILMILNQKRPQLKIPLFILVSILGLYVPFAFLFSQATVIHPYAYDSYIVIPLILALFSVFPSTVEKLTGNKGTFIIMFFIIAYCYTMTQIRAYAIQFPLTN